MKKHNFKIFQHIPQIDSIANPISDYRFDDKVSNWCFISALILLILSILLVWRNYALLPSEIPLFFQLPWGVKQLAPKILIGLQPGLLMIFFIINYALSLVMAKNELLVARILGGTVLICSFMSLISLWNIISLMIKPLIF